MAIFFLAFLPLFITREPGKFAAFITLGLILICFSLAWEAILAIGSARIAGYLTGSTSVGRCLNRVAGTLFFGLGVKLAL